MLGTPEPVYPILARKLTEVMTFPLPATSDGTLSLDALDGIRERLSWADVLMIGPGLSQNLETQQLIFKLLLEYRGKVLVDADGLNAIAANGISQAPFRTRAIYINAACWRILASYRIASD